MNWDDDEDQIQDILLLVSEAATFTHRTRKTIYKWIKDGQLIAIVDEAGKLRVRVTAVMETESKMGYNSRKAA